MTLEEIFAPSNQGKAYSLEDVLSAVGGQYQPKAPSQATFATGAQRFIDPNAVYASPAFTPAAFDITKFTMPSASTGTATGTTIGTTTDSGGDSSMGTTSPFGTNTSSFSNLSPSNVQLAGILASLAGVPFASLIASGFKNDIASALNSAAYNSAVANNVANAASQLGLDPADPANQAAIAAMIDSMAETGGYSDFSGGVTSPYSADSVNGSDFSSDSYSSSDTSSSSSDSGGGDSGGDGWASGGYVSAHRLIGPNPAGQDDGYGALDNGEYVIQQVAVDKYGVDLLDKINSGKISKKKMKSLL